MGVQEAQNVYYLKRGVECVELFLRGVKSGVVALGSSVCSPQVQRFHTKEHFKQLLPIFLGLYLLLWVALVPVHMLLLLVEALLPSSLGLSAMVPTSYDLLRSVAYYLPPFMLMFFRVYFGSEWSDEIFFAELGRIHPSCSSRLRERPYPSLFQAVLSMLKRTWRLCLFGVALFVAGLLPVVGNFVHPLAAIYSATRLTGCVEVGCVLVALGWLPGASPYVRGVHHMLVSWRSVSRELLDPYLSRAPAQKSPQESSSSSISSPVVIQRLGNRLAPFVLGFAAPAAFLLTTPFVGPLAVYWAQASFAHLTLLVMTDRDSISLKSRKAAA